MKRPLFVAVTPLIAGIITASLFTVSNVLLLGFLSAALAFLLYGRRSGRIGTTLAILMFSFYLTGLLSMNLYTQQTLPGHHIRAYIDRGLVAVDGVISEDPQITPDKTDLIVSVYRAWAPNQTPQSVSGKILLAVKPILPLRYGDVIRFHARLRAPNNFSNPGGFDYIRYLQHRGVWVRGYIAQPSQILILREEAGGYPAALLVDAFRRRLKELIRQHSTSPAAEIIQASILGNQREIPRDTREKFNMTGTSHIIAISGFNMGIIALFTVLATRLFMMLHPPLLLRFDWRRVSAIPALLFVILYTFIAGAGISVIRATIMISIFMCAILFGKLRQIDNTLALAAFLILIFSPHYLFDISFQLSFIAVLSLIYIAPCLAAWIPKAPDGHAAPLTRLRQKSVRHLLLFATVTLSAVIGTLPVILFYFNHLSLVVLLSNLLVVPILGIIAIPVCMLMIIVAPVWEPAAVFFIQTATVLVEISLAIIDRLAAWPYAAVTIPTPTLPEITAYYLFVFVCIKALNLRQAGDKEIKLKYNKRLLFISAVLLAVFTVGDIAYWHAQKIPPGQLSITAIDVGHGSSTLVRFPKGKNMLIDGGGFYDNTFDIGKFVVAPFLWHERISTIHTLVLTHLHPDHLNGLFYILRKFRIEEIWIPDAVMASEAYHSFKETARTKHIPIRRVSTRTPPVDIEGIRIVFLNPPGNAGFIRTPAMSFEKENDSAIVMQLTCGDMHFLFPSDISSKVEKSLIKSIGGLRYEMMLAPHHGSRKSNAPEFLQATNPRIAILSVGKDNLFRLPHEETLERYKSLGIPLYRTDHHGAITVTADGRQITVNTFKSGVLLNNH